MATKLVAFFINNYMVVLIILNIVLIGILLTIGVLYIVKTKKDDIKSIPVNEEKCCEIEPHKHNKNKTIKRERVFEGRFITDEEYYQMKKNRRSDISILLEEVDREYEHFKELSKW